MENIVNSALNLIDSSADTGNNVKIISSLEIASASGKRHDSVTRDIDKMLLDLNIDPHRFVAVYKDSYGRDQKCYNLDDEMFMTLVSGYNVKLRNALVKVWQDKKISTNKPQTTLQLLKLAVSELEEAEQKLLEQKPKVELAERYLDNGINTNISTTAKPLGLKVSDLKQLLYTKYIFQQRGNDVPYSQYQDWFVLKPYVAFNGHKGLQLLITPEGFYKLSQITKSL
jgi:phage regulator Rha-like protein